MLSRALALVVVVGLGIGGLTALGLSAPVRGDQVPADLAATATGYADALAAANSQAAWKLLSEQSRKETDAGAWLRSVGRRPAATKPPATALLKSLAMADPAPIVSEALVRADGALVVVKGSVPIRQKLALVREKDGWRVDLKASDELNSKQAGTDFLGAVREDAGMSQPRTPRPTPEASLPLLRLMLAPEAKDYRVEEAEIEGDRASVTVISEVPVSLVLKANRSGAGWMVDLSRPVVPVDVTVANPLQEAASYMDRSDCEEQLRQLVRGIQMYAAGSDDMLPDPARWLDQIGPYLTPGLAAHCPRDASPGVSYAFNANLKGRRIKEVANPSLVPMLYESKLHTNNPADTGQSWAEQRHPSGNLVAFVDGNIRAAMSPLAFGVTVTSTPGGARTVIPRQPQVPPRPDASRRMAP